MADTFPHPYTLDAAVKFIGLASQDDPMRLFAIEVDGSACGGIGIHPQKDIQSRNAEIGYWLSEAYWNKGITSAALHLIIPYAFRHFEIERLFARPFGSNKASQKLLENCGFVLEARIKDGFFKHGRFDDELIYGLRRSDFKNA